MSYIQHHQLPMRRTHCAKSDSGIKQGKREALSITKQQESLIAVLQFSRKSAGFVIHLHFLRLKKPQQCLYAFHFPLISRRLILPMILPYIKLYGDWSQLSYASLDLLSSIKKKNETPVFTFCTNVIFFLLYLSILFSFQQRR